MLGNEATGPFFVGLLAILAGLRWFEFEVEWDLELGLGARPRLTDAVPPALEDTDEPENPTADR